MVVLNSAPRPARRRDPPAARVSGCEQRFRTQFARGRGRRIGAHGRRALRARRRRLGGRAPALVRGELLRPRGLARTRPGRPLVPPPARRLRRRAGRRPARVGRPGRRERALDRHVRAAASRRRRRRRGHVLRRAGAHRPRAGPARRARPAHAEPLPARRGPDGARPPEGRRGRGRADRLREHGHGAAGVQRDRGEDAGRPAARRPAAHDVHGRVRARRRRRTRTTTRSRRRT